jgi:hypothetical protein
MRTNNISRITTTAFLAVGLLVGGIAAKAATISLVPIAQNVADNASFEVLVLASGLPTGTSGGALDLSWNATDMTLDSVYLATTDGADSGGGQFFGSWDPVSSLLSGPGTIGIGSLSGLFVGSLGGVQDFQAIAQLNFTLGTGVSNSVISVAQAAVGGTWSAWDGVNPPYNFTNTYQSAVINPAIVPLPAAFWLFGSGLLGLVGVARRRGRIAPEYSRV